MTGLLRLVRDHADAVEADMQAVYHVRDRELTWRERAAFIRHLPDTAAVWAIDREGPLWTLTDHLLDDVRMRLELLLGADLKEVTPHSQRPFVSSQVDSDRERKIARGAARAQRRRERIAAGEIT